MKTFLAGFARGSLSIVLFPFRLLMSLGSAVLAITTLVFFLLSVSLPIVTTLSGGAYQVAAWAAEQITRAPDLLSRERRIASGILLEKEAALKAERAATRKAEALATQTGARLEATEMRAATAQVANIGLNRKVANLETELAAKAEKRVLYRGEKRLLSEIVSDTSMRVAGRVRTTLAADISGMAAEAVPYFGVAAIVSSIGYDAYQSCEMMKELHELDVAFNPDHAIDVNEVCGMRVPTAGELVEVARQRAKTIGDRLGDVLSPW